MLKVALKVKRSSCCLFLLSFSSFFYVRMYLFILPFFTNDSCWMCEMCQRIEERFYLMWQVNDIQQFFICHCLSEEAWHRVVFLPTALVCNALIQGLLKMQFTDMLGKSITLKMFYVQQWIRPLKEKKEFTEIILCCAFFCRSKLLFSSSSSFIFIARMSPFEGICHLHPLMPASRSPSFFFFLSFFFWWKRVESLLFYIIMVRSSCTRVRFSSACASIVGIPQMHVPVLGHADSADMVDLWDVMLQISMFVKELPPSLLQSGTEDEEEMMFLSLCSEMMSSVSRNVSRPRKSHT